MNQKDIVELLKKAKENSKPRKFTQRYDLIVSLKSLDLKKPEQQVDFYANVHFSTGKQIKICGLVGPELVEESKKNLDNTILADDFDKIAKNKKEIRKIAESYDYFVAQANIMAKVASSFGRIFGPRDKMPNPKVGCVVPPKTNLLPLYERLQKTVRVKAKTSLMVQVCVGNEKMKDEEVVDNIKTVYDQIIHHLPNEINNVKSIYLKTTMGKPVKYGEKVE